MPYHLYIKTHRQTGLKYLGQTSQDPFKYNGSGKYWNQHLRVHGDDIHTEIDSIHETLESLRKRGLELSKQHDVVNSLDWANLTPEAGDGIAPGSTWNLSEVTKHKISLALGGVNYLKNIERKPFLPSKIDRLRLKKPDKKYV